MNYDEQPKPLIIQKITTGLAGWNLFVMVAFVTLVLLTQSANLLLGRVQGQRRYFSSVCRSKSGCWGFSWILRSSPAVSLL